MVKIEVKMNKRVMIYLGLCCSLICLSGTAQAISVDEAAVAGAQGVLDVIGADGNSLLDDFPIDGETHTMASECADPLESCLIGCMGLPTKMVQGICNSRCLDRWRKCMMSLVAKPKPTVAPQKP